MFFSALPLSYTPSERDETDFLPSFFLFLSSFFSPHRLAVSSSNSSSPDASLVVLSSSPVHQERARPLSLSPSHRSWVRRSRSARWSVVKCSVVR